MSRSNIEEKLNEALFTKKSTTPIRLINAGTSGTPLYLLGYGNTVPSDGAAGWQVGAIFIDTDATGGSTVHTNTGTGSSSVFALTGAAAAS